MKNENTYIVGVIAEYNPFHNGHQYHIQKSKEITKSKYCIAVMSGDFVQRGAPAIYDKYTRTKMALECGADLVIELPSIFASSSAEDFASCGIALLDKLGVVDSVCFGSESGDIEELKAISSILAAEPPVYTESLKEELKKGAAYPKARQTALELSCPDHIDASLLSSPNNILGVEYCKALFKRKSSMIPYTIKRSGSGYHNADLTEGSFSSATGIRKAIMENGNEVDSFVPDAVKRLMKHGYPVYADDFTLLLNAALLCLKEEGIPLSTFADVSEELASRLEKQMLLFQSYEDRIQQLKTRQYTYTRISRALLHILLGITDNDIALGRSCDYAPYARVLGFRRSSAEILSEIKMRGAIPLITKTADADKILEEIPWSVFRKDLYCSHLYQAVVQNKYHTLLKNEYTNSVVIL